MKKVMLLSCLVFSLLFVPFISAENQITTSQVAYCEHMGYKIDASSIEKLDCVFNDTNRCNANDFYTGVCGKDMVKAFPVRQQGEKVYLEFEKCAEGLSIRAPKYLMDLPECYVPTIFDKISSFFNNFF